MTGETILVVDDEANIRELARIYLEQEGYQVTMAATGTQALDLIGRQPPSLVVLDLMLPEIDGWEVCRRVRATSRLPIIMLTARDDDIDKIVGLELGADDYVTKPFNPRELVARVRAVLRRSQAAPAWPAEAIRQIGNLSIDPAAREVTVDGSPVALRAKEFELLLALVSHANKVLTRQQLLDQVWGYDYFGETRTVDVHISHLRDKLGHSDLQIETVWGVGYKLVNRH
ncbi:MAG: response regulator transcription factor [Candidatus Promineifilaceae bacterium]